MSKPTINRIFIGSVIAFVAAAILVIAAVWLAYVNDVFVMDGPDVVGVRATAFAWSMLALAIVSGLAMVAALMGGLVAWIGALLNTAQLDDKTWFIILLLLGIWNLGVFAMVAYVIAGPDGVRTHAERMAAMTAATSVAVMPPKS